MSDLFESEYEEAPSPKEETAAIRLLGNPSVLLWAGMSLVVSALLLFSTGIPLHIVGYVFACLVPFPLVALYRRTSTQRMAISGVVPPAWSRVVGIGIILVGFGLALAHAWFIASGIA